MSAAVAAGSGPSRRILVIAADDQASSNAFRYSLEAAGYQVRTAGTGGEGLRLCGGFRPDLVLLEVELPDLSGLEVCRRIRSLPGSGQPAIVILTARAEEADRIASFQVGADDFVPKPFSLSELLLRIRARLPTRPATAPTPPPPGPAEPAKRDSLIFGPLEIDKASHRVFLLDRELNLSAQEMRLLIFLAGEPGKMHTRRDLLTGVWGYHPDATSRTLDTHIKRLRDKLGSFASMIQTAHGVGYRLTQAPERALPPDVPPGSRRRR